MYYNSDTVKQIKSFINSDDFEKGKNYFFNYINLLNITKIDNVKIYELKVESERNYNKYNCYIFMNQIGTINKLKCSCPQFRISNSCKHLAACLFKYHEKLFVDESPNKIFNITNKIFNQFTINQSKTIKEEVKLEVEFNTLINQYNTKTLNIKIGVTRLYIANNKLSNFLIAFEEKNRTVEFGKSFTYDPNKYYFNNENEQFLNKLVELRQILDFNYGRYLSINESLFKTLLKYLEGITFKINNITINSIEHKFPFNLTLTKNNDNYELMSNIEDDYQLMTFDSEYVLKNNKLYHLNIEQSQFLKALIDNKMTKLIFKDQELNIFSKSILPIIKNDIIIDEKLENIIITKEPECKLYFDFYFNKIICNAKFLYNNVIVDFFDKETIILRDIEFENNVIDEILKYDFVIEDDKLLLDDIDEIGQFLENNLPILSIKYEIYTSEKIKDVTIIKKTNVQSTFSIGKDNIMNYNFDLGDIKNDELVNIFDSMKKKKKYFRLKSGNIVNLEKDDSLKELENLIDDMDLSNKDIAKANGIMPKYRAIYLDSLRDNKYHIIKTNSLFNDLIDKFNRYKDINIDFTNEDIKILRDYQLSGIKWLYNVQKTGFGGILADEMGLGKSVQTIYFIKQLLNENIENKFLIIVPTSLAYNWEKEFIKFAPKLNYQVIVGNKIKRIELLNNLTNITITTYGLIREDFEYYKDINFKLCVIDEAQNIKNPNTVISKIVKKIKAESKFALTGTPLENSVTELWSIFDFIMPGFLSGMAKFQSKYKVKEFDKDTLDLLKSLNKQISPFILRRKKSDVIKELPDKIENNIYVDLADEQKKIYVAELEKVKKEMDNIIQNEGFSKSKFLILQLIMKLRQICIDPRILFENYTGGSNKIETLIKIIKESTDNGHKILLFTSFKTALEIVRMELSNSNISNYTIDGSVSSKMRMELVDKFNNDDTKVFLIMLKSGGTGLNLTSADIVIHLDLWWNPQVENQATDRAHRIGQNKVVEVIKLITKGTIEEKILELQKKKKTLSDKLIESDDRNKNIISKLTEKDIKNLLSYENND